MVESYDGWSATFSSFTLSALGWGLTKKNMWHSGPVMTLLLLLRLFIVVAGAAAPATAAGAADPAS